MDTAPTLTDPLALLRELTPEQILARLSELEGEARALRVLLRSARARESVARRRATRAPSSTEGGPHAA